MKQAKERIVLRPRPAALVPEALLMLLAILLSFILGYPADWFGWAMDAVMIAIPAFCAAEKMGESIEISGDAMILRGIWGKETIDLARVGNCFLRQGGMGGRDVLLGAFLALAGLEDRAADLGWQTLCISGDEIDEEMDGFTREDAAAIMRMAAMARPAEKAESTGRKTGIGDMAPLEEE